MRLPVDPGRKRRADIRHGKIVHAPSLCRKSLLDNSTVLYGSSMKDGNRHKKENLPIVLAGRGGGSLKPLGHVICNEHTPLANLHLTLLQKYGIEKDSFNNASTGTIGELI